MTSLHGNPFVDEQASLSPVLHLWSVTTLTKMGLGTGQPLLNWAVNYTAGAAIDSADTLATMVRNEGREAAVKWLADRRFQRSEEAKVRGSDVHRIAEAIALGLDPGPIPPGIQPYVDQLLAWLQEWQPRFLMAECPVYNPTQGYAGTCDGIMELDGRPLIFDYKTTDRGPDEGKSRPPYPEVGLQLCAYRRAECVGVLSEQRYSGRGNRYYLFDPTIEHEPMPQVAGAVCIVISPYDCFATAVRTDDAVFRAFTYVQQVAAWHDQLSKDVLGATLHRRPR